MQAPHFRLLLPKKDSCTTILSPFYPQKISLSFLQIVKYLTIFRLYPLQVVKYLTIFQPCPLQVVKYLTIFQPCPYENLVNISGL